MPTSGKSKPVLLAGGNPQIAKADGDSPVRAYISAIPGWKRDVGRRLDALIASTVRKVCKAVRWNSPMHGIRVKAGSSRSTFSPTMSRLRSSGARR
jgi:hypothetical protein